MGYPKCFPSQGEFDTWVRLSENDGGLDPRISFCDVCTVKYQAKMIEEARCENPELVIDEEKEDIVNGERWNQTSF